MNKPKNPSANRWHRLDNTANIFPVITSKRFSNVFRLSINLSETVDPELLQRALEIALPRFAAFRVRIRRGLFWHYLETNNATPQVTPEADYPCTFIDPQRNNRFLFRVTYCHTRINLEVFHVLSDGVGGYRFLQAICCQYLMLAHPAAFSAEEKARSWFTEHAANTEDSYAANYTPTKKADFRLGRAYKLTGERYLAGPLSLILAHIPLGQLLPLCREKQVSITQYITACIAWAVYTEQLHSRPAKRPVNIMVPVNLRNLFPSSTSLNFFSPIYVSLRFQQPGLTFGDLLAEIKQQFEEKLTRENMLEKISYTVGSGYSPLIRAVPLPLKMLALRLIFNESAKSSTLGFSNTGQVVFPEVFRPYITGVHTLLSCVQNEPVKFAAASYGDTFTLTITSFLRSVALQRAVVRRLAADGLQVTLESNGVDYENV